MATCTSRSRHEQGRRSLHGRSDPQRDHRDRRGNVARRHALRALAAAARGGRPVLGAYRSPPARLVAQGRDIPAHLGIMGSTVREFLKRRAVRAGSPPATSGSSTCPKWAATTCPTSRPSGRSSPKASLQAFAVSLAHWADIGGALPGSYVPHARDTWQEGLQDPAAPAVHRPTGPDREKLDLVHPQRPRRRRARGRHPAPRWRRPASAEARLRRPVRALRRRHDARRLRRTCTTSPSRDARGAAQPAARRLRRRGFARRRRHPAAAGRGPRAHRLRRRRARLRFLRDRRRGPRPAQRDPASPRPPASSMRSRRSPAPDIQPNAGCCTAAHDRHAAGIAARAAARTAGRRRQSRNLAAHRRCDLPRPRAGHCPIASPRAAPTTSGLLLFSGTDPRTGRWATLYEVHGGGEGARHDRDGGHVVRAAHVKRHEHAGRGHRGRTIRSRRAPGASPRLGRGGSAPRRRRTGARLPGRGAGTVAHDHGRALRRAAYGLAGGAAGAPFRITLERASGESMPLSGKTHVRLGQGDRVIMETSGGGGFGPAPHDANP